MPSNTKKTAYTLSGLNGMPTQFKAVDTNAGTVKDANRPAPTLTGQEKRDKNAQAKA